MYRLLKSCACRSLLHCFLWGCITSISKGSISKHIRSELLTYDLRFLMLLLSKIINKIGTKSSIYYCDKWHGKYIKIKVLKVLLSLPITCIFWCAVSVTGKIKNNKNAYFSSVYQRSYTNSIKLLCVSVWFRRQKIGSRSTKLCKI